MIKIGIISDIHGNDIAFKKAIEYFNKNKCDRIISLGDLIGIGPNSNEVLDIARNLDNFTSILGNHEKYLLYGFDNPLSCVSQELQTWTENQISKENIDYLKKLKFDYMLEHNNKKIGFVHYARFNYNQKTKNQSLKFQYIVKDPEYNQLVELFKDYDYDVILHGHEHKTWIREGDKTFINPGSLGCPNPYTNIGKLGILILDEKIEYQKVEIIYDPTPIFESMKNKNMPSREFISRAFFKHEI